MSDYNFYFVLGGILFLILFITIYIIIKRLFNAFKKKEEKESISSFKCLDGHKVRSKGELIIDNYLYHLGIKHEYERTIRVNGTPIKYDWYLPDFNIYIEYWGYFGKKYEERKEEKLRLYRKGKLKLISIENLMFSDIYTNLINELKKIAKFNEDNFEIKHCPNCGIKLDERF